MRHWGLWALAAALVVAGCSNDGSDAPPITAEPTTTTTADGGAGGAGGGGPMPGLGYENGTRLRARVYQGDDGSRQFLGWYDNSRDSNCSIVPMAGDGRPRCIPVPRFYPSNYTSDSTCSDLGARLVLQYPNVCDGDGENVAHFHGGPCPTPVTRVWQVLGSYSGPAYHSELGNCQQATVPSGTVLWQLGSEIPASVFAAAVEVVE
jgi:hypothetical protein